MSENYSNNPKLCKATYIQNPIQRSPSFLWMVTTNADRRSTGNLISNARLIERSQRRCSHWWYQILCKQNVKAFKCMCPPRHGKVFLRGHQQVTRQKTPPPSQYLTEVGLFCKMFDKIIIIQRYASPFIIHFYVHKKNPVKIHFYTIADYNDITK